MPRARSILITGASSGIGEALAYAYAAPGVRLHLGGRDAARLAVVVGESRARGATVEGRAIDVTDRDATRAWVEAADDAGGLDLVIANAGISAGMGGAGEDEAQTRRLFAVNVDGLFNTVWPLVPRMRARRAGHIAVMSSLAGYRGFPGAPAYSATKAAVKSWGEAMRGALAKDGVTVSVICPGWVKSRMTEGNRFPMPFLVETDRAGAIIKRGLDRGAARIAFPWPVAFGAWLFAALPASIGDALVRRLPEKEGGVSGA
ncbi:MAG: SDR family NAD(P)-dependent oxidoreductase [Alphaproteobacteria bacterium]|nr:SDR family NAD(P)-dependent oxidoreductase [Alphaproteobacteria bacterium]